MTMEDKRMMLTDEEGNEHEVEILLTFEDPKSGKNFVLFMDPAEEDAVYAYTYDEDGNLDQVTDEKEWEMCQEVLGAFIKEDDDEDEAAE